MGKTETGPAEAEAAVASSLANREQERGSERQMARSASRVSLFNCCMRHLVGGTGLAASMNGDSSRTEVRYVFRTDSFERHSVPVYGRN